MRKAIALLLALALAGDTYAATVVLIKKPAAGPSHPADVLLWTNWEAGACPNVCTYTQHATTEFAVSDNVWTNAGPAAISTNAEYLGTLGLEASSSGDHLGVEVNATDECTAADAPWDCCTGIGTGTGCENVSPSEGNIGFWFQVKNAWTTNGRFFRVKTGNSDEFYCILTSSDDISCSWEVTSNTTRTVTSSSAGLVIDTWYHLQYIYDEAAPLIRLIVKSTAGAELINVAHTVGDFPPQTFNTTTELRFGTVELFSAADGVWVDQVVVSNDSSRDIYTDYGAVTNYP